MSLGVVNCCTIPICGSQRKMFENRCLGQPNMNSQNPTDCSIWALTSKRFLPNFYFCTDILRIFMKLMTNDRMWTTYWGSVYVRVVGPGDIFVYVSRLWTKSTTNACLAKCATLSFHVYYASSFLCANWEYGSFRSRARQDNKRFSNNFVLFLFRLWFS